MIRFFLITFLFTTFWSCSQSIPRKPVSKKSGSYIAESVILNKKIKKREEDFIKKIIETDTANAYLNSGNGFWYRYTKKDTIQGYKPKFGDLVNFDFNLKNLNGEIIYTKKELKNRNYVIDKEELFYGLREGIKLLQAGESAVFYIPSHLAYGYYGDTKKIGSNMPLISEVTVNSISKN